MISFKNKHYFPFLLDLKMPKSIVTYFKKLSFSNLTKTRNPKIISFLFLWKADKKKFPPIVLSW